MARESELSTASGGFGGVDGVGGWDGVAAWWSRMVHRLDLSFVMPAQPGKARPPHWSQLEARPARSATYYCANTTCLL